MFDICQALVEYGSFELYPLLIKYVIAMLHTAGPMLGVTIVIGVGAARITIVNKQNNAEDEKIISEGDKSKYILQNSTPVSSDTASTAPLVSSPNVSSSNLGGNNLIQDYNKILERYIDDLYNTGTEGDNMLQEVGLGRLVDNY